MLQAMRDNAQGIIAKVIVFFIIIVFALFGVESIVSLGGGDEPSATVGGLEISELDITRAVEQQKANLRRQFGEQFDENLFSEDLLRSSAIEQLVQQNIAIVQADELGLYASGNQIDEMILSIPAFQLDGKFNKEQFRSILRLNGWSPLSFRDSLAQDIKVNQVQLALSLTEYPSDYSVQMNELMAQEKRTFSFAEVRFNDLLADVEVTDEDIDTYYQQNGDRFKSPETVSVNYVTLSRKHLMNQLEEVDEADLRAAYDDYVTALSEKEERQASHILIEINDDRSEAEASQMINELAQKLAAGESFAELAKQSDDIATSTDGGDLGFSGKGIYDPAFEQALFALERNQVSEPVKTEFGYHLIKLMDVRGEQPESFEQRQAALTLDVKNGMAQALLAEQIQELSNIAFTAANVEEVASTFGLTVETSDQFTRGSGSGVATHAAVRNAAFADNVLLDGELSEVIEANGEAYVLAIAEHKTPELLPLETVQNGIKMTLQQEKAAEQARLNAKAIADGESSDETLEWKEVQAVFAETAETPRSVQMKAFAMAEGTSDIVDVSGGVAIVKLQSVATPELDAVSVNEEARGVLAASKGREQLTSYAKWAQEVTEVVRPESASDS
ncbi:MAG: SurA N-terminal domain-containing protein [Oceanobacter sp.]